MLRRVPILLRFWFALDVPVDRRAYLLHGLALAVLKYAGDVLLVWLATDRVWTPQDYLRSVYSLLTTTLVDAPAWLAAVLTLWTIPFLTAGVSLTLRRAVHAGWSPWWALGFFVPAVNYLLIAALCVVPGRPRGVDRPLPRGATGGRLPAAFVGLAAGVLLGLLLTSIGVATIQRYGLALFFGTPFAMGALAAFLFNRRARATGSETAGLTVSMFIAAAASAFLVGMEGAVCLAMALPFAIVIGILGAVVGRAIALTGARSLGPATFAVVALPVSLTLEPTPSAAPEYHVASAVEIDAPPEVVWRHVIAFRPIAEPTELIFRLGVAYPTAARLEGTGVGAVRYCEFSTGPFVEPITAWEPHRRLSFDVMRQPPPLRELSLHDDLAPPHLTDYVRARRGEFRLVALEGGRTRLEGSTWYEIDMSPAVYWRPFADYMIHRIHLRVLGHIERVIADERAARAP